MTEQAQTAWLLAIDTSSDWTGIALTNGDRLIDQQWDAGRKQTTTVLAEIDRLMRKESLDVASLGAVAVAIGPGSFSGLRVGMSLAKGLCLARDMSLIGVPTLLATLRLDPEGAVGTATIKAGRARSVWCSRQEPDTCHSGPVDDLIAAVLADTDHRLIGEIESGDIEQIKAAGIEVVGNPAQPARVAAVAALGWNWWQQGRVADLAALEPIYVHGTGQTS